MSDADTARVLLAHVAHRGSHWSCGPLIDTQRNTLASNTTKKMLSRLNSMGGGTFFDSTQIASVDDEKSERNPHCGGFNVRAASDPDGYTRATPDPKHHGQTMRSSLRVSGSRARPWKCKAFGTEVFFTKFYALLSPLKIEFLVFVFTKRLSERGGNLISAKSAL